MHTTTFFKEKPLPLYAQRKVADLVVKAVLEHDESSQKKPATRPVPPEFRVVKVLQPGNSVLPQQLLRGIFALSTKTACSTKKLCTFDDISDTSKGGSVEYKGEPLVQADLRVLLGLIKAGAALEAESAVLTINAVDFLRSIGKKNPCSRAVEALRDSIAALASATFVVKNFERDRGELFGFIDRESVRWDGRMVTLRLSPKLPYVFQYVGRTYVDFEKRCLLKDGVETALSDLIRSTHAVSYDLVDLAELWGRKDAKELGREVREALDVLVGVGLIKGWHKTRGRVHVQRTE